MSREIRFRAWDIDLKRMRTVSKIEFVSKYIVVRDPPEIGVELRLNEYELMQNTGLRDRNEKEIFESDLIRFVYEEDLETKLAEGVVEWNDDGYWQVLIQDAGFSTAIWSDKISDIEIIGNYYESPRVGEGEKENA